MKELNERLVIEFDPFQGDFGDGTEVNLKDKVGKTRKTHLCHHCNKDIPVGETARIRVDIYEGEFCTYYWCNSCCKAMEVYDEDNDTYESRTDKYSTNKRK